MPTGLAVALFIAVVVATVLGVAAFAHGISRIVAVARTGAPDGSRFGAYGSRLATTLTEVVAHTRMLRWSVPGAAHWFVMVGFVALLGTLITAYGEVLDQHFTLPFIGRTAAYGWFTEVIATFTLLSILTLIVVRQIAIRRTPPRRSRFLGSTSWQAYYVELTILAIAVLVLLLRGLAYALDAAEGGEIADVMHFPASFWIGELFAGLSIEALEVTIALTATVKILVSMAWFVVIGLHTAMGVAWHRFTAVFNIFFKRKADGGTALGALRPLTVKGAPVDFENIEDLDEDANLGAGKVADFSWKAILDFTTCTECGRCQSQCPAWHTEKPLSPKLVITSLRDQAHAAHSEERLRGRPLVGDAGGRYGFGPGADIDPLGPGSTDGAGVDHSDVDALALAGVMDPDVLWACTTCGACVEQCPVDIEHVDHIVEMRRHQVLMESAFPNELNGLFKNLDNKGNPWGMSASARLDWAKDLPFEVAVLGDPGSGVESLEDVEYLLWVGCAGAFDDRAKRTVRALAELLYTAGVSFAVLGDGETCTGDPARRAGNEFLFQQLAMTNAETLREARATKVVTSCPHCFNTLGNEYTQIGLELDVVHHTQLLNRLVREKRLVPVAPTDRSREVTYHDPCYLGRHNGVYAPPRELLGAAGTQLTEMPRNSQRSFCCGAGGARMWMEESIGTRINMNRTEEALATGAGTLATGCPFCRVMLSDGVASKQGAGEAPEDFEVVDVAQLLLDAVRRGQATHAAAGAAATTTA